MSSVRLGGIEKRLGDVTVACGSGLSLRQPNGAFPEGMPASAARAKVMEPSQDVNAATRFGFLLMPEFPVYALIPAIESLRIANQNIGRKLFDWRLISATGDPVTSCGGMSLTVDASIADIPWYPVVLVFAGNHPVQHLSKRLLNWLRKLARHGSILGGIDTGAFALAEAGLLDDRVVCVHWESITTFQERYPGTAVCEQLFVIDRDRMTCAGGHATLDLMLHLIAKSQGPALAHIVANGFVSQRIRKEDEPQRLATDQKSDAHSQVSRILHDMEKNISSPLSAQQLAKRAGVSLRALNRVLRDRIGESPMRYYCKMRLQAARSALFYSDTPIQDIATSCGFASPEVFSRTFKRHFGLSPREFRQRFASEELRHFRPELEMQLKFDSAPRSEGTSGYP